MTTQKPLRAATPSNLFSSETQKAMEQDKNSKRGKDTTGSKRVSELRERTVRMPEVHLTPEAYAEVEAMLLASVASSKAELLRQALHEKYLRWQQNMA